MANYTFTFKKDDVLVDFSSTDKDVVEKQFQIWVADADAYAKEMAKDKQVKPQKIKSPKVEVPAEVAVEVKKPEIVEPRIKPEPQPILEVEITPEETLIEEEVLVEEPPIEDVSAENPSTIEEVEATPEVFDKASSLLKTINTLQDEKQIEQVTNEESLQAPDFGSILETSIETSTFEPVRLKDENFLQLIESKNTNDKFNYFIVTAYYLLEKENLDRFSLKQINAKLMQNLSMVVDHTVLQDAINAGFAEVVPDLTGSSDTSEYRLTEKGEQFFQNEI